MKYLLLTFLISTTFTFAQTDWVKWDAADPSYEMPVTAGRDYQVDNSNIGIFLLSGAVKTYHVLFSDVDGDNCPFYPSCSEFFISSVKNTNIFKGTLMFVDRFTRDINFFKSRTKYPFYKSGKLYDPIVNYTLNYNSINYIPHNHIVE